MRIDVGVFSRHVGGRQAAVDEELGAAFDQAEARPVDDVDVDPPALAAVAPPIERGRQRRPRRGGGADEDERSGDRRSQLDG